MATPINFSVPASRRSGTFSTTAITLPAGYSRIYWELSIPKATEYEDPGNSYTAELLVNDSSSATTWVGGRTTNKAGTIDPPPAIEYDISAVPAGATLQVRMTIPTAMTVGIQNGVVS